MWKRDVGDAKNTSLLKLGTLGDSLQSTLSLRSSAKKKRFLLQSLEPEKAAASWGGASQVEASSGEFRAHYFLFLIDHFILLAAASQEALGPRKEPAGLLPGSDDRPADVLLSLWAKMLPLTLWTDLVDGTKRNGHNISFWSKMFHMVCCTISSPAGSQLSGSATSIFGGHEGLWVPGGARLIPGELKTRWEYSLSWY